jgi:hypothetical protein
MRNGTYTSTLQVHCQRSKTPELRELLSKSPHGKPFRDFAKKFDANIASVFAGHASPDTIGSGESWRLHQWGCRRFVEVLAFTVTRGNTQLSILDSVIISLELITTGGFPDRWVADLSTLLPDVLLELTFRSVEEMCAGLWQFKEGRFVGGWMDEFWDGSDFDAKQRLHEIRNPDYDEPIRKLVAQMRTLN